MSDEVTSLMDTRPAVNMALTVALAQMQRGDDLMPNIAKTCALALRDTLDALAAAEATIARVRALAHASLSWPPGPDGFIRGVLDADKVFAALDGTP